jgi:hypothetical protein
MKHLLFAAALVFPATQIQAAEPDLAHMVFFTLAEDTTGNRETLVAACQKYLSDHDGTVYFSTGSINEDLDRDVNDKEFDVALHVVFDSRKAHDKYQTHPQHLKFIDENKHLWSAVRVFDSNVSSPNHDTIPEGGKGFAGMISGEVSSKQYGQTVLNVTEIGKAWRHSQAKDAPSLVGRKILVDGREKATNIAEFISRLKVGETITVDVANKKGDSLTILELTEDQRTGLGE